MSSIRRTSVNTPSAASAASTKKIVVIDSFQTKKVDLDGDGTADVSHGEFVSRLIQGKLQTAGKKTVGIEKVDISSVSFETGFNKVTEQLRTGEVSGINLSKSFRVKLADGSYAPPNPENLGAALYPNDSTARAAFIARGNAGRFSAADKAAVRTYFEQTNPADMAAYKTMVGEAAKRNIPVTVSAGNEPNQLNVWSLYEPTTTVGSLGKGGATSSFSSRLSGADTFATGELNHRKVTGGIDVTGDGKADFSNQEISGGTSQLSQVLGKSYDSVKASEADYTAVAQYFSNLDNLPVNGGTAAVPNVVGKVFDLQRLTSMMNSSAIRTSNGAGITDEQVTIGQKIKNNLGTSNKYLTFTADPNIGLSASGLNQQNNKLVVDVEGTGGTGVLNSTTGTSWAAPIKLVDLVLKQQSSW